MTRQCIHTAVIIIKSTVRRLYFWCFLIGSLALMAEQYIFYLSIPQYRYLVMATAPGMELLILGMLVMGVQIVQRNNAPRIREYISALPNGFICYTAGSCLAIVMISIMITFGITVTNAIVLRLHGGCSWYWIMQVSMEFILRYFFGCVLSGWLGLLIGEWVPGRLSYIAVFVCWFFMGAQHMTMETYLRMMGIGLEDKTLFAFVRDIWNLLYLHMPKELPDANVGASIEAPRWIVRVCQMLWLGICCVSTVLCRHHIRDRKGKMIAAVLPLVLLVFLTGGLYSLLGNFYENYAADIRALRYFSSQYDDRKAQNLAYLCEKDWPREDCTTVLSNDIELKTGLMGIQVKCSMELKADSKISGQLFTLDRNYRVKDLQINGSSVFWEQSLDGLWVDFGKILQEGELLNMTVAYEGMGSPQFPASWSNLQLRDVHPWIPWPGLKSENDPVVSSMVDERQTDIDTVAYTLTYQGPPVIYTNLKHTGGDEYAGTVRGGVVLLSDMVPIQLSDGRICYIPVSMVRNDNADVLEKYLQYLQQMYQKSAADTLDWLIPEQYIENLGSQQWDQKCVYIVIQREGARSDRVYRMRENEIEINLKSLEEYDYSIRASIEEKNGTQSERMNDDECITVIMSLLKHGCSSEFQSFAYIFPYYSETELAAEYVEEWKKDTETVLRVFFDELTETQRQEIIQSILDDPDGIRKVFKDWYLCELKGEMKYNDHLLFYEDITQKREAGGALDES